MTGDREADEIELGESGGFTFDVEPRRVSKRITCPKMSIRLFMRCRSTNAFLVTTRCFYSRFKLPLADRWMDSGEVSSLGGSGLLDGDRLVLLV